MTRQRLSYILSALVATALPAGSARAGDHGCFACEVPPPVHSTLKIPGPRVCEPHLKPTCAKYPHLPEPGVKMPHLHPTCAKYPHLHPTCAKMPHLHPTCAKMPHLPETCAKMPHLPPPRVKMPHLPAPRCVTPVIGPCQECPKHGGGWWH